jgi:hypothetical protein
MYYFFYQMEYIDTYHTFDRKLKLICVCLNSDSFISGQQYLYSLTS